MINICLQNMKGLSMEKLHLCHKILSKHLTDIIIITETWQAQDYALFTPLIIAKSIPTPRISASRGTGGLLLLTRPGLKKDFQVLDITTHSITFKYKSYTIHAVYLPPKMTWDECQQFLPKTRVSLLLGDLNCSMHHRQSTLLNNRRDEFMALCIKYQLEWNTASSDFHNDQVLSQIGLTPQVDLRRAISPKTDHQLLTIALPSRAPPPPTSNSIEQTIRFNLKYLDHPQTCQLLHQTFTSLWNDQYSLFSALHSKIMPENNPSIIQPLLDTFYDLYTTLLKTCCEATLGTYIVQERTNTSIDHSIDFLRNSTARHHAIRLFKRSQRGKQQPMASDNHPLSPLLDATNFYKQLYNPDNSQRFRSRLYQRQPPNSMPNTILKYCNIYNIRKLILKYPGTKSFGLDTLHINIFKTLCSSPIFMQSILMLFHMSIHTTLTPTQWNTSQIVPIPKKSTTFTPSTSRPISLTPCLRRVFESLLLQYIYADHTLNNFSPYQAGFRPGYNTTTHLWLSQASTHFPDDPRLIHIFLDLEKAYDRVPIPRLLDKLLLRKTPPPLIQLIDSLFSNCHSQMIVNQTTGPSFQRSVGLFQGSILSPWLFNVYIDDLALKIARIDPHPIVPPLLLFADDIKLQPSSINMAHRMLAITTTWCVYNGIRINVAKSGVISNNTTSTLCLAVNNQPLPIVTNYEYLGLPFHAKGINFPLYVKNVTRKTEKLFFATTKNSKGWSPFIRLLLFKTFIRPSYEYALPLLFGAKASITPLIKFQDMVSHWIVNGHRGSVLAHAISGLSPIPLRLQELTMRFQFKLETTHTQNPIRSFTNHLRHCQLPLSTHKYTLAPLLTPIDMYKQYLARSNSLPPWTQYTFTEFILEHKIEYFQSLTHVLPKNILPVARDSSLVDISLRIKKPPLRSLAIRWRANRLLANYRCQCGAVHNRGHLETCYDLTTHQLYPAVCSKIPFPHPKPSNHYSLIDHALNTGELQSFIQLLHFVTKSDDFLFVFDPP